jgi:hypothetical protein
VHVQQKPKKRNKGRARAAWWAALTAHRDRVAAAPKAPLLASALGPLAKGAQEGLLLQEGLLSQGGLALLRQEGLPGPPRA